MYYYSFGYSGYDYKTDYILSHTKKYSGEKFSEIVDTACEEVGVAVLPEYIKKKNENIKFLRDEISKYSDKKKNDHDEAWIYKKWLKEDMGVTDIKIRDVAHVIVKHLVEKYGFKEIEFAAEQDFDEDYSIGKIPAVK